MNTTTAQTQRRYDRLDATRAEALYATLDRKGAAPRDGDPLPPFWHQIYFWDTAPGSELGYDGHPRTGGLIPDMGLPQRMWAGGRLAFHAPLILGQDAEKLTTVEAVTEKQGRSGRLAFVTLRHDMMQDGNLCVTEHQDIVYRHPPEPGTVPTPPMARDDAQLAVPVRFPTVQLFRYSALTFNGHRIHYDLEFCREERHAGIVVHGPLLAQLMVHLAEEQIGPLTAFQFRATAPLYHDEAAELCWNDGALWVRGPDGRQCMQATAS